MIITLLPETLLLLLIVVLFVMVVRRPGQDVAGTWLPMACLAVLAAAGVSLGQSALVFGGTYKVDALSQFMKMAIGLGLFMAVTNARNQATLKEPLRADYYLLLCTSAWGLMLLASSVELMTIYISLEISSYSLYALIPLRAGDRRAAEAGIKYVLFGAAATAVSLYGFAYITAAQHTTFLAELADRSWDFAANRGAVVGLVMFMAGFMYKLALFPFHFWCPDVYQGASNETAAFAATLPKLGAVVVLVRLASLLVPGQPVMTILAILGAVSMTFGNLSALVQKDVKRMLGYSSIAHAGYVTIGLVAGTAEGLASAAFYALVYMLMNLTCFWVVCHLSRDGRNMEYEDLDGLHQRSPILAFVLAVAAFSLVGLPPTAGFMGKLFLLTATWGHGYDWLVIIAALNTAISIYFYLSLVRHAYTHDPSATPVPSKDGGLALGTVFAGLVLFLGVLPAPVYDLAVKAGQALLP
jgi:NADH-quinone oxidoreductase subunit N